MKAFTDTKGKVWEVNLDIAAAKRIKSLAAIDILKEGGTTLAEMFADPIRLIDTLYAICKPQADAAGIDDPAFGERCAVGILDPLQDALLEAVVDFFPKLGLAEQGKAIAKVWRTARSVMAAATPQMMDKVAAELVKLERTLGTPSVRLLDDSESIPAA